MAKALDVYLHSHLVGNLIQDDGGQMTFRYAESWLSTPGAAPLSQSLPLRKERFARKECQGFFAGILPEESKREIIARNLGISARNDFAMLEQIGGECAGAVSFISAGEALPESNYSYRTLSSKELAAILKELPKRPLLAGEPDATTKVEWLLKTAPGRKPEVALGADVVSTNPEEKSNADVNVFRPSGFGQAGPLGKVRLEMIQGRRRGEINWQCNAHPEQRQARPSIWKWCRLVYRKLMPMSDCERRTKLTA
jgi:HipA-like protein